MNAQRLAANLPNYLVIVVLLVLTGCTTIRAATSEAEPVPTATISSLTLPPHPTPTATTTTQKDFTTTPLPTLLPTPSATSTSFPPITPIPALTATQQPVPSVEQRYLVVNQDEQMMAVYENDIIIRTIPVSTGAPVTNRFTPPWQGIVGDDWGGGPFRNRQLADYKWYLYPGPEGSILLHSVPYTITNGLKAYDRLEALGVEPVSNGCVRISPEDAAWLKNWDLVGVPITITRWSGKIQPADTIGQETAEER